MTRPSISFFVLIMMLLTINPALALSDYRCLIQRIITAEEQSQKLTFYEKNYLNKEFTVERSTGLMAGALKNSYVTKPQVIDYGSHENSFKVITTMRLEQGVGLGSNVYMLTINEYSESSKKPFVFIDNDVVYLGECVHF